MPRAGLTPDVVVAAAAHLADAGGYDRLSLAAVAERLGVRVPSLYKHVGSLADLQRRLATAAQRDLDVRLRDAAVGRSGRDALAAVARAYRAYGHEHPGRYTAALRVPDPADAGAREAARSLTGLMLAVVRGYGLEGEPAVHAVRAVRAAMHGFVALEHANGFGLPLDVDDSFERLVALLDAGLSRAGQG